MLKILRRIYYFFLTKLIFVPSIYKKESYNYKKRKTKNVFFTLIIGDEYTNRYFEIFNFSIKNLKKNNPHISIVIWCANLSKKNLSLLKQNKYLDKITEIKINDLIEIDYTMFKKLKKLKRENFYLKIMAFILFFKRNVKNKNFCFWFDYDSYFTSFNNFGNYNFNEYDFVYTYGSRDRKIMNSGIFGFNFNNKKIINDLYSYINCKNISLFRYFVGMKLYFDQFFFHLLFKQNKINDLNLDYKIFNCWDLKVSKKKAEFIHITKQNRILYNNVGYKKFIKKIYDKIS